MLDRMRAYVLLPSFGLLLPLCSLPLTVWRQGHVLRFWSWSHCSDASHPGVLLWPLTELLSWFSHLLCQRSIYHQKLNLANTNLLYSSNCAALWPPHFCYSGPAVLVAPHLPSPCLSPAWNQPPNPTDFSLRVSWICSFFSSPTVTLKELVLVTSPPSLLNTTVIT